MNRADIPVGTSDFAEIRMQDYYFVDKSELIEELLKTKATKVTLITRPRRFGKTLAMRMLSEFFDIRKDSRRLFFGLNISANRKLCEQWMNQYPTLWITFKDVGGNTFDSAWGMLKTAVSNVCVEHAYLLNSEKADSDDRERFAQLKALKADPEVVKNSIAMLIRMMKAHYGKPVILLLDEYDVPVARAGASHEEKADYQAKMMDVIGPMISTAIKDNPSLKFAVLTGCLRIAKESIFTGTNNLVSDTISDTRLNEYFGFTQPEVDRLLRDTGLYSHREEIREWYDGYHFGAMDIYCPWDVMNYVNQLLQCPDAVPESYWENTSHNDIIRQFLNRTQFDVHEKFEHLLAGGYITEPVEEKLTYNVLTASEKNLWTLLYFTGYLTRVRNADLPKGLPPKYAALKIPNAEIMELFRKSVREWLYDQSVNSDRRELFSALWNTDAAKLTEIISNLLFDTISYHDYRESYYHAFVTGLFSNAGFRLESNYEYGPGRSDLVIKDRKKRRAVVIEAKWAESEETLERECEDALRQIDEKQYAVKAERDGYLSVGRLGMAFFQKKCLVKKG